MNNILLFLRETDKHIFYSPEDDLCALTLAGPREELFAEGDGYLYQEKDGDNRYSVEPLGSHFFYYEAHF